MARSKLKTRGRHYEGIVHFFRSNQILSNEVSNQLLL